MRKVCTCPNCGGKNVIDVPSWDEEISQKLPGNIGKAVLVTAATAVTGFGGVLLGGYFWGGSVERYLNGTKVSCGKCGYNFYI